MTGGRVSITRAMAPRADLIQEIGIAIATRRRPAVRAALGLTKWIFERGDHADQETLRQLTIEGLGYLDR